MDLKIKDRDIEVDKLVKFYQTTPNHGTGYIKLDRYVATKDKFKELEQRLK